MYALVDCNNFYCSCERLFNPKLEGRPVIVLSNNDGCAISRSDEAKALGIEMGVPAFLIEDIIRKNNVAVFSSNYTLYGDMSDRVMKTLSAFCSRMEIYSIDEAFLDLHHMPYLNLPETALRMRQTVKRNTGIPITIGIAQTKTLAKIANRFAKKRSGGTGVFAAISQSHINSMLEQTPVSEIWGIGRQHALLLKTHGFHSAADFIKAPPEWVRVRMSVVGQRLLQELKGIPSVEWECEPAPKKNIATTRSFGKLLTLKSDIAEALSNYAANCALKLRQQKSRCRMITVFVQTNPMKTDEQHYTRSINVRLETASNDTAALITSTRKALDIIYQPQYRFLKGGVTVSDLVPDTTLQKNAFDTTNHNRNDMAMSTMDAINRSLGKETVRIAAQGFQQLYRRRAQHLSRRYTTQIDDILKVTQ